METYIGRLEVVTGSMFSGKSEELIRRLRRSNYAKQKILVFSPSIDNRYGENGIYSHNKNNFAAHSINSLDEMENILTQNPDVEVIGIDEIQFFPKGIVDFCKKCVDLGKRVIVAGLDQDFRALPFKPLPELMAIADEVTKLSAICTVCGKLAYASQRLIDGEPAFEDDPLVLIGNVEKYEARCRLHHIVRKRKEIQTLLEFVVGVNVSEMPKDKFQEYHIYNLDTNKNVCEIRNDIFNLRNKYTKLVIFINKSVSFKIEGNYTIIDFMKEFIKISRVNLLYKKDENIDNILMTTKYLLEKCDLKIVESRIVGG
ncbi:thymidine kinase [Oceanivirga salmonicida]|uniref:thymidine kinase n=1 Tax=Oceanivirga salmonicida TaxID=1769291 RepID=UPI0022AF229F|nr:thymidine kinase [Oceanivirga salmonicida]